jgi:hypothetical protein
MAKDVTYRQPTSAGVCFASGDLAMVFLISVSFLSLEALACFVMFLYL